MLDHPSAVFTATSCGLVWRGQPLVASLPPERMITALLTRTVAALGAASGALSLYDTRHGGHRLVALTGNDHGGSRAARVVRDDALPASSAMRSASGPCPVGPGRRSYGRAFP